MKKHKHTKTLMEIVKSMLDESGYHYENDEDVVKFSVSCSHCVVDTKILVDENAGLIIVYGLVNWLVKPEQRAAVLKLLNEKNAGCYFTTLFLDPSDGQVMCRALCYGDTNKLTELEVTAAFASVIKTLDEAFPEIVCKSLGIPPELIPSDTDDVAPDASSSSDDFPGYGAFGDSLRLPGWTPGKDNNPDEPGD